MTFKDHFSGHAEIYAQYRPGYPRTLFSWLARQCPQKNRAWDCATGNGQAARLLATEFATVVATDASETQIANAGRHPRVLFRVAPAENSGFDAGSLDLITVAQALHWFDTEAFYAHAESVLKPGGVLAVWTYQLFSVSPEIDALIGDFYAGAIDRYWPPQRQFVEAGYEGILPHWPRIDAPDYTMRCDWSAEHVLGFLSSWSAVQRFQQDTGEDALETLRPELIEAWGDEPRSVRWPLVLHVFRRP